MIIMPCVAVYYNDHDGRVHLWDNLSSILLDNFRCVGELLVT